MTFQLGDDGEINYLEPKDKPKRKQKSLVRRSLRGCAQLFFLTIFLMVGFVGGFALYFVRNPIRINSQSIQSNVCPGTIKMISVAGASVMFPNPPGSLRDGRTVIGLDGHSTMGIDRSGQVDSLNLAKDEKHVIESRYEQVAPYFFIYTWVIDNFGQFNERILTDGKFPSYSPDNKRIAVFRFSGYD